MFSFDSVMLLILSVGIWHFIKIGENKSDAYGGKLRTTFYSLNLRCDRISEKQYQFFPSQP